ncbi:MAG: PepSY-associated TM helix domain-containing protein, partial [Planctomycetota bacterium]
RYGVTVTSSNAIAVMNDLHKGRDSGTAWSLLIDISAILMAAFSVSGFGLLFYLKKRRTSGVVTALIGTILVFLVWAVWVP